jgi:glycosyltransferase involved in cell wall biosynthesis
MKILHVVPESAVLSKFHYSGSTKDIFGRLEYFKSRAIDVKQVIVKRSDESLLESLEPMSLSEYSAVMIEFPIYPKSMEFIRRKNPNIKIYTRSINAELYHKLHLFLSNVKSERNSGVGFMRSLRTHIPILEKTRLKFKQDRKCGNLSDVLLSITDWETRYYWRYLIGNKAETVPYYLPEEYSQEIRSVCADKENICVSFMGVKVNRGSFLADSLDNFVRLVNLLKDDMKDWSFKVTGELHDDSVSLPARVEATGFIESPYPLLARSRAVAILSPYGMGFKTKILEAILAGCYVLLPTALLKRQPEAVKPFCIEVNLNSVASFKHALAQCLEPFPACDPNLILKDEAFRVLDRLFKQADLI